MAHAHKDNNMQSESILVSECNMLSEIKISLSNIDLRLGYIEKRLDKLDGRLWQIILLLLSYPLGLIVGKLCHVF